MIIEVNEKMPNTEKALFIAENATIAGNVTLEEGVTIWYGAVLRGDTGAIHIGKNSNIQDNVVIHTESGGGNVNVGENVVIGHSSIIHGCTIGNNCMIGMGSILMNFSQIGDYSLVAAGSMVTEHKQFPAQSLLLGSPAKVLKPITKEQIAMIDNGVEEYLQLGKIYSKHS